jgi:osmotically-inducible protein OsmY
MRKEKITDELLKKDITRRLYWDDRIDASNIKVIVKKGYAYLNGTVNSYNSIQIALSNAANVRGVKDVINELTVEVVSNLRITSTQLEESVKSILQWSPEFRKNPIGISVNKGVITLKGNVNAYWKKKKAENLLSNLSGIVDIKNQITVVLSDKVIDKKIAKDIMRSLKRDSRINPDTINVVVDKGTVILTGKVSTWFERKAAYESTLFTKGVKDIKDKIEVSL